MIPSSRVLSSQSPSTKATGACLSDTVSFEVPPPPNACMNKAKLPAMVEVAQSASI